MTERTSNALIEPPENQAPNTEIELYIDDIDGRTHASTPTHSTTQIQLAAVHALVDPSRTVHETDIVLNTALELLRDAPLSLDALVSRFAEVWPGAKVTKQRIETALCVGEQAGLLTRIKPNDAWTSTQVAGPELRASEEWAQATMDALAADIREIGAANSIVLDEAQAHLWADTVGEAIHCGIRSGMMVFSGGVVERSDKTIAPQTFDHFAAAAVIEASVNSAETVEFMIALVAQALDRSDPFGNDLVSSVCKGYVLHAFLAHRDNREARHLVGSLRWSRVIIETPWLLEACGGGSSQQLFTGAAAASLDAGVEVVVPRHCLEEAQNVLRKTAEMTAELEEDLAKGIAAEALMVGSASSGVLDTWLAWVSRTGQVGGGLRHSTRCAERLHARRLDPTQIPPQPA